MAEENSRFSLHQNNKDIAFDRKFIVPMDQRLRHIFTKAMNKEKLTENQRIVIEQTMKDELTEPEENQRYLTPEIRSEMLQAIKSLLTQNKNLPEPP